MADTVINTPSRNEESSTVGWIVALIVVLAVIVAGFVWVQNDAGIPNTGTGTDINLGVPASGAGNMTQ